MILLNGAGSTTNYSDFDFSSLPRAMAENLRVGILKETKPYEGRVAMTPEQVQEIVRDGSPVSVERNAGELSGYSNEDYKKAGALILNTPDELIGISDLVIKVKEPTKSEISKMNADKIIFSYLHLAPTPDTVKQLLDQRVTAIGYETVELDNHTTPLLKPMSEVAGQLAVQYGAQFLTMHFGGSGVLLGGTDTVLPGKVLIIGAGIAGLNAAKIAVGMGADTWLADISSRQLVAANERFVHAKGNFHTFLSSPEMIAKHVPTSDLVVGTVHVPGGRTPILVTEEMVRKMRKGSVIVDVSVDQGGCIETSEITSHQNPVVNKHGVLHYGVPNMPAATQRTSTKALTNATFPYTRYLARHGLHATISHFDEMRRAVNVAGGKILHPGLKSILR